MTRPSKDDAAKRPSGPPALVGKSRVDLKQLAKHLGLSSTTISLVLNDAPLAQRISVETRERVLAAAKKYSYRPNYFARSLSGKRSRMIGVLAPDFGDGYDSLLLTGIEHRMLNDGYMYFVSSHLWSPDVLRRSLDALVERGAEGLLLVNTTLPTEIGLPTVGIGSMSTVANTALISIDNAYGMHLAFQHLAELGHTRIALLKGHEHSSDTEKRWQGGLDAAAAFGIDLPTELTVQLERLSAEGILGIDDGYVATTKLLERGVPFTALVCFNDMSACGAIRAIRDAGLRVPEDRSVVGFDDIAIARVVHPTLTTVRQPLRDMGDQAAETLIRAIEQKTSQLDVCMRPELVVRQSTTRPSVAGSKRARRARSLAP